eukprot:5658222-Alexandrium_andersonii.AAC.1
MCIRDSLQPGPLADRPARPPGHPSLHEARRAQPGCRPAPAQPPGGAEARPLASCRIRQAV